MWLGRSYAPLLLRALPMNQYQLKYLLTVLGAFALLVSFTWLDGASGYSIENKRLLSGFFCLVYFAWAFSFRGTYQKIRNTRFWQTK
jgi:hypothetical protein